MTCVSVGARWSLDEHHGQRERIWCVMHLFYYFAHSPSIPDQSLNLACMFYRRNAALCTPAHTRSREWTRTAEPGRVFLGTRHVPRHCICEPSAQIGIGALCCLIQSIWQLIKSPATTRYSFEAFLLLAVLASYHRVDAASLNPYLKHIQETHDDVLMHGLLWVTRFACARSVK